MVQLNAQTRATSRTGRIARKYELLTQTITSTILSSGRWPAYLKRGDFIKSLLIEGVSLGLPLLRRSDADLIAGAKSIARKLIHREKHETRWYETDASGKNIRKSKSVMRVIHPVLRTDEDGASEWISPLDNVQCDADGRLVGIAPQNYNQIERRLVEQLDQSIKQARVIAAIGVADWQWCLAYTDRKRSGTPIPARDRNRFQTLKAKVLRLVPTNGSLRR